MGWGRTLFLGDIGNRLDIQDVEEDVNALKRSISSKGRVDQSQDQKIQRLEQENEQLKLYLAAISRLLVDKKLISRSELEALVVAIDAEDGVQDGKFDGSI